MPKKRGWFGRAKSSTGRASTGSVSRPPTAYTPPPRKSKDGDVKSSIDDELPPREVASPPPMAGSAAPSTPKTADEAGDLGAPELPPAHAGFNISAIKAVIDSAAPSDHPPPIGGREPPPAPLDLAAAMQASSSRPQSAPPPHDEDDHTPTREKPEPTLSLRESIDEQDDHASIKLSTPMTRSLSLNDVPRADESVEDEDEGRLGSTSSSSRAGPSNGFAPPPSFGEDTAIWAPPSLPEKDSVYRSGSFGSPFNMGASPFGASTTSFGAPSSSGVQLSFGGVDGDITSSSATSSSDHDPWAIPSTTKAPPSYLSNPWG